MANRLETWQSTLSNFKKAMTTTTESPSNQHTKLITNEEYLTLANPQFVGQTRPDKDGRYEMHWENEGVYYYTVNRVES